MVTVELLNDKSCEGHSSLFAVRWNYNRYVRREKELKSTEDEAIYKNNNNRQFSNLK